MHHKLFRLALRLESLRVQEASQIFGIMQKLSPDSFSSLMMEIYRAVHAFALKRQSLQGTAKDFLEKILDAKSTKTYKEAVASLVSVVEKIEYSEDKTKILSLARKIKEF